MAFKPRKVPFCQRDHVKRSLSPAICGSIAIIIEFLGVFQQCGIVTNASNDVGIGLNSITQGDENLCDLYPRGFEFDTYLFSAKVMSGLSLTLGGFALLMTFVSQFLWAGTFFWRCLAFWDMFAGIASSIILLIFLSPLCNDENEVLSCVPAKGAYMIIAGAALWFISGILACVFPPPDVPVPIGSGRPTPVMSGGADDLHLSSGGHDPSSPFSGVAY